VAFGIPRVFTGIEPYIVMSFVIVLLYLIGPINGILGSVPSIMRLKIAWKKVNEFINEIPANLSSTTAIKPKLSEVKSYKAVGIQFQYKNLPEDAERFVVGPIDFTLETGEILFVIGGNGSGKTTLAKLLLGLYAPDAGHLEINGKVMDSAEIGEYCSSVFSPPYLFKTLYGIDANGKSDLILKYLKF
jgi:ABC-type siderophore export system fused ATPase/permease subunit